MHDKTKSIVAHLTLIGWVIALILNQQEKGPNSSYYLRQNLGLMVLWIVSWVLTMVLIFAHIFFLSWIFYFLVFILWIISLIYAAGGTQKPVPIFGELFQQWFKGIS